MPYVTPLLTTGNLSGRVKYTLAKTFSACS